MIGWQIIRKGRVKHALDPNAVFRSIGGWRRTICGKYAREEDLHDPLPDTRACARCRKEVNRTGSQKREYYRNHTN